MGNMKYPRMAIHVGLLAALAVLLSACGDGAVSERQAKADPAAAVTRYFELKQAQELDAAWAMLTPAEQEAMPLERFREDAEVVIDERLSGDLTEYFIENTSREVQVKTESESSAEVLVDTTRPNVQAALAKVLPSMMGMAFTGATDEELAHAIEDEFRSMIEANEIGTVTESETVQLLRVDGAWRLERGYQEKAAEAAEREAAERAEEAAVRRAEELVQQAREALDVSDYEGAKQMAQEAQETDRAVRWEASRIERTAGDRLRQQAREAERQAEEAERQQRVAEYLENVELYDIEAKRYETWGGREVAGVRFKLRNRGDLELVRVRVEGTFYDADGTPVHDDGFTPVSDSVYAMRNRDPLRPGRVWQMSDGQFYSIDEMPSEWDGESCDLRITDLEFAVESD